MPNPWKIMTILLASFLMVTVIWQYVNNQSCNQELSDIQAKSNAIIDFAKQQGIAIDSEASDPKDSAAEPETAEVSADDDFFTGNEDAKATLIIFTDYECPFCSKMHESLASVREEFGDDELRIVYRDFPLPGHPNALPAAKAAEAAGEQDKFLEMADLIFENMSDLSGDQYVKFARELKLDMDQYKSDVASDDIAAEIEDDKSDAESYGVTGTPAAYLNGSKIGGYLPADKLADEIRAEL